MPTAAHDNQSPLCSVIRKQYFGEDGQILFTEWSPMDLGDSVLSAPMGSIIRVPFEILSRITSQPARMDITVSLIMDAPKDLLSIRSIP